MPGKERVDRYGGVDPGKGIDNDFAAVLIRGSSSGQVGIFLDGIPLTLGRGGLLDLSLFPPFVLSRIEIFRGFTPVRFASSGATSRPAPTPW